MLRVALTGGIGTGKSYVVRLLRGRSVPTVDADQLARAVVQPDQPACARLRDRFGPGVFAADGTLDRARLGRLVFADATARAALETLVHPPVREAIDAWFRRCRASTRARFAVADIPLLFETGRASAFDRVVVVACDPGIQVQRVTDRDGLPAAEVRQRVAAQIPIAEKVTRAHAVIRTDGSFEETDRQVASLCRTLS
ncbi:MAG: dephospho-CoA kinase [Acidobacteria bacterium]|nr:dephospho-CoA kinase [Acidobacteriota bacterium]